MKTLDKRFWDKVDTSGDCWEWCACRNSDGYGNFFHNGKVQKAHRVSYEISIGAIPPGLHVMHSCDNPSCVNPSHLSVGTHRENMDDRNKKGRSRGGSNCGSKSGHNKLTEFSVRVIRRAVEFGVKQSSLAVMFSVHKATINDAVLRKTWGHI